MLKLAAACLFLLLAAMTVAQAQEQQLPNNPMYFTRSSCDNAPKMLGLLTEKYGEELLFIGEGITFDARTGQPFTGGMMFLTNQDTGTFSVVQVFADGVGCMIMNGREFTPYGGGPIQ